MKTSSDAIRTLLLAVLAAAISQGALAQSIFDQDIEVLQSDNSGVVLRYTAPEAAFTPFRAGGKNYYTIDIPRTAPYGQEGVAEIPIKIVPLAIPPGATVDITVLDANYSDADFKTLPPYFSRNDSISYEDAYRSVKADDIGIPVSAPFAGKPDIIRGLNVVKISIPTARYAPASKQLSILKNTTIKVTFTGGQLSRTAGFRNPGQVYDRILRKMVANYETGKNWFTPRKQLGVQSMATSSPFDSASTWIRVELTSEGIYGIGWPQFNLVGINPLTVDPTRVRVFYGGGLELPETNVPPRPLLKEIPVKIYGGEDGQFDNGDLIVFYADAVDSWQYNTQFARFMRYKNHYTDKNVYWLTIDGDFSSAPMRMVAADGSPDGAFDASVESFKSTAHKEQDKEFWIPLEDPVDYFEWYWGKGRDFSTTIQLYDMVGGMESTIIARHQSGSPTLSINGSSPIAPQTYQTYSTYRSTLPTEGTNSLELVNSNTITLDYFDVLYQRWLKVIDGNLLFTQPDTFGTIRYTLTQVGSQSLLLDITNRVNPVEIIGGTLNGTTLVFDDTTSQTSHKRYYISSKERFKSPGAVSLYAIDNLRDINAENNRGDEIIIAYDSFADEAEQLAEHRRASYGFTTRVVKVSDIYNQFAWGLTDPVAIRDFLKYVFENWAEPAPTFALLLGDGNYDFRNNLGTNVRNYIPPFAHTSRMSDEYYVYFGSEGYLDSDTNRVPDMLLGRVNARSSSEADDFVAKTIDYDSNSELGPWRSRIVVVADDNLHPGTQYSTSETYHTTQAENLANRHIPGRFEPIKVYMLEYLMGNGYEKPDARETLLSTLNQGELIVDWIGHGSANLWADEHIFRRLEDIPRLVNGKKMPMIFTASCSIGKFDVPNVESMAEEFIRSRTNRAISVVSATRDVYAVQNGGLNEEFFDQVLNTDSAGIGEALYVAKYLRGGGGPIDFNDRYYQVFGDPAQVLQFPKYDVRMIAAPDSLRALSVDSLSGEIIDNDGNLMSNFNGTVWVTVKDGSVQRQVVLRDWLNTPLPPPNTFSFLSPGPTLFVGPAEVRSGRFTSRFFVPKDVSYGTRGAKIYIYSENGTIDALGVKDSILISGSLPSIQDSLGPTIALLANGQPFSAAATIVPSNFTLGAEITDDHGINITGQLGHGIVVTVDDGEVFEGNVTSYFSYDLGQYTSGHLEVALPNLPLGEHQISLKVWDNFNNSSVITRQIEVLASGSLQMVEVMNYPNPIKAGATSTEFQYCLNEDVDKVMIQIFTESGKKIKTIDITSPEFTHMDCNRVSWDLLDGDSDKLANGIYLYKVSAEVTRGDGSKEKADETGKLVILR